MGSRTAGDSSSLVTHTCAYVCVCMSVCVCVCVCVYIQITHSIWTHACKHHHRSSIFMLSCIHPKCLSHCWKTQKQNPSLCVFFEIFFIFLCIWYVGAFSPELATQGIQEVAWLSAADRVEARIWSLDRWHAHSWKMSIPELHPEPDPSS